MVSGPIQGGPPLRTLRLKGLDPDLCYQAGGKNPLPGSVLMEAGWPLPLPWGDYQAWQFYLTAV